jgi:hypothetical protein
VADGPLSHGQSRHDPTGAQRANPGCDESTHGGASPAGEPSDGEPGEDPAVDVGPTAADVAPPPPLDPLPCAYEPEEGETCDACFLNIQNCCYDEEGQARWARSFDGMVKLCEATTACKSCCNKCATLSCDQLLINNDCPIALPLTVR